MRGLVAIVGLILIVPVFVWLGARWYQGYQFDVNCGNYLKRAADAPNLVLAAEAMDVVLLYCYEQGINENSGQSDVIFQRPVNDVGYWFEQLINARSEITQAQEVGDELTESNALMKLREVLLDSGASGDTLTLPIRISVFPGHVAWFWSGWALLVIAIIGAIMVVGTIISLGP